MNRKIVFGVIASAFVFVMLLGTLKFDYDAFAQTTASANATMSTKWTDFFKNSEEFLTSGVLPTVEIPYESDKTIVVNSKYIDAVWRAVDYLKADGYKIDDVVQYETTGPEIMNAQHIDLNFMVILSK